MSAGTGITHSEFNPSRDEPVHFLQIWILPDARGLPPATSSAPFADDGAARPLPLVASRDGRDGSVTVHQDVDVYVGAARRRRAVAHPLAPGRHAWVQVARGDVELNGSRSRPATARPSAARRRSRSPPTSPAA